MVTNYVSGNEFLVNTDTNNSQSDPAMTTLSNGNFVVTWTTYDGDEDTSSSGVKAQLYQADGTKIGSEFLVNSDTYSGQFSSDITALSNGNFVVTWATLDRDEDNSGYGVKAQLYQADGTKIGTEFLVNTATITNQQDPAIAALSNGNFVVTWETHDGNEDTSDYGVKAQIYQADGTKIGSEFLVNTDTNNDQVDSAITALSNGNFVVTWRTLDGDEDNSFSGVKAQLYQADGTKIGTEFLVNTDTNLNQYDPAITTLSNGNFVVTWETGDGDEDNSFGGVKAQLYQADGTKIGTEFLVNTDTNLQQGDPVITALSNGNFVVTWQTYDLDEDSSSSGVKAQLYQADGTKIGTEFLVNTDTNSDQGLPAITALANGSFVVSWATDDGDEDSSDYGVKAKIFTVNNSPVFTSADTISMDENTSSVVTVTNTDADGDTPTYTLSGGADQTLFAIDSSTGELTFLSRPDFENPGDTGTDNVYDVEVTADDGNGGTTVQAIAITVDDVAEGGGSSTPTNELVLGTPGNDSLVGGEGNDTIAGFEGDDIILGGEGNDELRGGQGNDELYGSTGNDTIYSGQGDDTLQGGEGNDVVIATGGNNVLLGGKGDDVIIGSSGNDLIRGGNGTDTLTGGDGVDIFQFTTGQSEVTEMGADQITDFVGGVDQIDTPGVAGTADNFSDLGSQSSFDSALAAATTAISTATGVIYVETEIGGVHYLFSDDDGDGTIDMAIQVGNDFGFADIV